MNKSLFLATVAFVLANIGGNLLADDTDKKKDSSAIKTLSGDARELKALFNKASDKTRMILLVAPT